MPHAQALTEAIDRAERHDVETTWFDSYATSDGARKRSLTIGEGMIVERRQLPVAASSDRVFAAIERIGGDARWPYADSLWRLRGLLGRAIGGVGMRLGRRDPERLRAGDALDFWRVEEIRRPTLLRLRAEMKLSGRAWLQYDVVPDEPGCRITQTAFFEPRGLAGLAYWYALYPVHRFIFRGMIRALSERATSMGRPVQVATTVADHDDQRTAQSAVPTTRRTS